MTHFLPETAAPLAAKKQNRARHLFAAAFAFLAIISVILPTKLSAQTVVPFKQRTSVYTPETKIYHLQGDFTMIGNSNQYLEDPLNNYNNINGTNMVWANVDSANGVSNSSSARLQYGTERGSNPECTHVVYAGLYWVGRYDTRNRPRRVLNTVNLHNGESIRGHQLTITVDGTIGNNDLYSSGNGFKNIHYKFSNSSFDHFVSIEKWGGSNYALRWDVGTGGNDNGKIFDDCNYGALQDHLAPGEYNGNHSANNHLPMIIATHGDTTYTLTYLHWNKRYGIYNSGNNYYATIEVSVYENPIDPRRMVKFKHENGTYQQIVANANDLYYPTIPNNAPNTLNAYDYNSQVYFYGMYAGYAEVTDYVREYGEGNYFVADITADNTTLSGSPGCYAAWTLVVIYENSNMKWRDITVFDGYNYTGGNNETLNKTTVEIDGFKATKVGPVDIKLGMAVADGDMTQTGDGCRIEKLHSGQYMDLTHPNVPHTGNTDRDNPTSNFFHSSIWSEEGDANGNIVRNPNYENTWGADLLVFRIPNVDNSVIANEQTSTRFQFYSNRERITPYVFAMGVDALIPDAQAIDAVWENSAAVYDPTNDVWISHPGDTVTFTINVHNYDVEDIEDALITLPMPATIEFYDLESEYFGGTTGEGYFNPLEGVNGTAHWTIDHLPAGYPDSVWATFKLHCYITTDCYILASTSPDCLLELVVNGTLSGTSAINRMPFVHPFIQGFQQEGVCKGSAISEDLHVIIDREDYVNRYCNCSDVEGQFSTTCYENREVHFCPTNGEPISFYEISKLYPEGTKFYLQSNRDKEYTYETGFPVEVQHGESIVAVLPSKGECESNLTLVQTISIDTIELPDFVSMPITYCLNEEARPLSESIIIPDTSITNYGAFVVFFKQNPGDDPRHTDITAYDDIIPKTDEPGTTDYWVVQFANAPGMECYNSTPTKIDVLVKSPVTMTSSVSTPTCVGEPVTFTPDIRGGVYDIPDDIRPYFSVTNSVATLLGTAPTGTYEFTYTAPVGTDDQGCPTALTQTITHVVTATSNADKLCPTTLSPSVKEALCPTSLSKV